MQIVTRKPKPAKVTRTAQIAQLEQKLDGLVNILTKPGHSALDQIELDPDPTTTASELSHNPGSPRSSDVKHHFADTRASLPCRAAGLHNVSTPETLPGENLTSYAFSTLDSQPVTLQNLPIPGHTSSNQTPEESLEIFRKHLARQVPFIIISPDITAQELEEEKPFVWRSIVMAAAFNDASHQIVLGNQILKSFADAFIVRGEKTLDLLQGLLIFLSWYQYHFHINMQLNNLLSLTNALYTDLGLNKPTLGSIKHEVFANEMKRTFRTGGMVPRYGLERGGPRSMEERRTMIGCFYLLSCVTSLLPSSYVDPIRSIPFMKESCSVLDDGEMPNDRFLVQLTRLQFLMEKIRQSGMWEIAFAPEEGLSRAPLGMYLQAYLNDLRQFMDAVPYEMRDDTSLLMHYYTVEMHLYEIGFYMPSSTTHPYPNASKLRRCDILHLCLLATKNFLHSFLAIPPRLYFSLSLAHCGQMMYMIAILSKLSLFKAEDWDLNIVRSMVDLSAVEDDIINRMEEAASIFEQNEPNGLWSISARRLRKLKAFFDTKLAELSRESSTEKMADTDIDDGSLAFVPDNFDVFGDSFWHGISGDAWEFSS